MVGDMPFSFGVLITTYRRAEELDRRLDRLRRLRRAPDEMVVTVHDGDDATAALLAARPAALPLRTIPVPQPGIVAARNAGLAAIATDVIAVVDDDTVSHPDWSEWILSHVDRDPKLGGPGGPSGPGGKDRLHDGVRLDDPAVLVDHFSGRREEVRHDATVAALTDQRGFEDFASDEVVALWDELSPARRAAFVAWSVPVGTRLCPVLAQAVRLTPRPGLASWQRFRLAQQGKLAGWRARINALTQRLTT